MRGVLYKLLQSLYAALSCEFLLTDYKRPNSGTVVVVRAAMCAATLYCLALVMRSALDPASALFSVSMTEARSAIRETLPWFGAIFAGVYVSLYSKFSSQWLYLANLYNQIKQTEAQLNIDRSNGNVEVLAEWKAGFIADADTVHLACKEIFAFAVSRWAREDEVQKCLLTWEPKELDALLRATDLISGYDPLKHGRRAANGTSTSSGTREGTPTSG